MSNDSTNIHSDSDSAEQSTGVNNSGTIGGSISSSGELDRMNRIDQLLSHIWMVRTFLKHSDEAAEDEELAEVHRGLYDYMLALGPAFDAKDATRYLHLAGKKFSKLKKTTDLFLEIQPQVSGHMNFCMAAKSLALSVSKIGELLG